MINKEKNFVSAVVYLYNDEKNVIPFFEKLLTVLEQHFEQYEFIAVNDACTDNTIIHLKDWAKKLDKPLTILNMSMLQSKEVCMNAGLDAAIGDYVYEFDSVDMPYPTDLIYKAYETALKGNDIVSVSPTGKGKLSSNLFYSIFNSNSGSAYKIKTDLFRLVTRRAINRVHASSDYLPYRKAAYAASGLKIETLDFKGKTNKKEFNRLSLAVDSLSLYTNAGYKISAGISVAMILLTLAEAIYSIIIFFTGKPIEGWTTTMLVLTIGFAGLFIILTLVIKYLSLIVDLIFKKQKYLIESIEKIQK